MFNINDIQNAKNDAQSLVNSNLPWEEKYRGTDLESIILHKNVEQLFKNAIEMNSFDNYILHSGSPGTGKTMAAQVLANRLHLSIYRIDLSQMISKYIGETEKNMTELFQRAENMPMKHHEEFLLNMQ